MIPTPDFTTATIACGDRVAVFPIGAYDARLGVVLGMREDGLLYHVQLDFAVTGWYFPRDVALVEAAAAGSKEEAA